MIFLLLCLAFSLLWALAGGLKHLIGNRSEGVWGRRYMTKRAATCSKVIDLAEHHGVILIKAPPQSGKTSLLQLLKVALQERGSNPFYFSCSKRGAAPVSEYIHARAGRSEPCFHD